MEVRGGVGGWGGGGWTLNRKGGLSIRGGGVPTMYN